MNRRNWGSLAVILVALPAFAQQTGAIVGKVVAKNGRALKGVQIEAASNVLPQPRKVVTGENGEYRLPFLPPGTYTLTFVQSGMMPAKRSAEVLLQQNTALNVTLSEAQVAGAEVEVVAQANLVDRTSSELKTAISADVMNSLPVGHDYRDLLKLIPGVQHTQDAVRGPSAGGSGQDNVYKFDGVNVNLPLFGTLSAEPATHDMDQIAISKGGAAATDFNRSAGFTVNSVSKSGTNTFTGALSYQVMPDSWVAKRTTISLSVYEQSLTYLQGHVGGPILKEHLFFFVSYYRPTLDQQNRSNVYGDVPNLNSTRNEYFAKLTWAPTSDILINASYRNSDRKYSHYSIGGTTQPSAGTGGKSTQEIGILEGTWSVTPNSFFNFKMTDYGLKTQATPDTILGFKPALDGSVNLNISALNTMGAFTVPTRQTGTTLTAAQIAYNALVAPYIATYSYPGNTNGGGLVGANSLFDNDDFYRQSWQLTYDLVFGSTVTHELHLGYMWSKDREELYRYSNGWGAVSIPFRSTPLVVNGKTAIFQAQVQQQGILGVPPILSEYVSYNFEVNDKIRWKDLTFNVGFLMSDDELYGQGLRRDAYALSGFVAAPGNKYLMHEIKWKDTFQPRIGVTWNYRGQDSIYANYARYVPAASSLPRAASWARNKATTVNAYFDANGIFIGSTPEASSSGKLFQAGLKPRAIDEYLVGTTKDFGRGWSGRLYGRYRYSDNFWEDTNNNARVAFNPPDGIPRELYIPDLTAKLAQIGSGSSFVIAHMQGAFTKYYEAGLEAEWRGEKAYFRGSYVWSHYYGNFDQDSTSTPTGNDANLFIGSSNIGDDPGRQIWDNKYGNLTGDRRHLLKLMANYNLPWNAQVGAWVIYQSGQPWQIQSVTPYLPLIGSSYTTGDTNRYAEPAGSRRTDSHYQMDLKYTQAFLVKKAVRIEVMADCFNVFNKQTGYNVQSLANNANFMALQSFWSPRRFQLGVRFQY